MAKQFIISAMEEVLGEYVLNMSKEKLRIAAVRGVIKLDDVQLDGDLIGSLVLGPFGLNNFGVLYCSAKSIRISVPWKNLEKEPTKFEMKGVHLVCVPLIPSTANQIYGAGTSVDPRCTLRTRSKRLTLHRYERNYWSGQIEGEGPPMKRIQRAVKEVERELRKSKKKMKHSKNGRQSRMASSSSATLSLSSSQHSTISSPEEYAEMEEALDNLVKSLNKQKNGTKDKKFKKKDFADRDTSDNGSVNSTDDYPDLPRDWKVKLREKVVRNMEASMLDLHIRCEVPERQCSEKDEEKAKEKPKPAEDRAYALGFTMGSLVVRTANENWEVGSHDTRNPVDGSAMSSAKDHLGPNEYVVVNNKIGYFNNLSVYWDDEPPVLLCETDALQGNYGKMSSEKITSRVTAAMEALSLSQEPGTSIRESLSIPCDADIQANKPHNFLCESLNAEVRNRISDRSRPGPISCSADILPFDFTINIRPHQYFQYQRLKASLLSQQRFDTMLRQRPSERPKENPRSWWKYAIACVTSRPNHRPWEDVVRIVKNRNRYIELVMKKDPKSSGGDGFHAGLSSSESAELLELEDLLPIEALLAFHLVALRKIYETQLKSNQPREEKVDTPIEETVERTKSKGTSRFRLPRLTAAISKKKMQIEVEKSDSNFSPLKALPKDPGRPPPPDGNYSPLSVFDAMSLRFGRKVWYIDWKLHDATVNVILRREHDSSPLVHFVLRGNGRSRSFGIGKRDFLLDLTQCDILHRDEKVLFISSGDDETLFEEETKFPSTNSRDKPGMAMPSRKSRENRNGPDMKTPSSFLELPPAGSICRLVAGKNDDAIKISMAAHPATLVWTTSLFDGISQFISRQSSDFDSDLTAHIRNAATPLARKAQLALLSPAAMALHLNISAPKVWVPLVSNDSEGTLFIDAGTIKFASTKDEGETEANWNLRARDIGVNFVRGVNVSRFGSEGNMYFRTYGVPYAPIGKGESCVVRPLSIDARSKVKNETLFDKARVPTEVRSVSITEPIRTIEVNVSPICLNLVDAEILARSFGKWYAVGVGKVKRRVSSSGNPRVEPKPVDLTQTDDNIQPQTFEGLKRHGIPRVTSITIEKLEMAVEGHSKNISSSHDEKSMASQDSLMELAPPTRAYLVEVFHVSLKRTSLQQSETTILSVMDASIIRLKDVSLYMPLKSRRDTVESQNCVLMRASRSSGEHPPLVNGKQNHIFRASLFHNRAAHLDEVEVDVDSVVLRVTPTTLKDCAKAFRRLVELAQLVTKEMERKVHEEGRKARRRDRRARDCDASQMGSVAPSIERPVSPSMSDVMTEFTAVENVAPEYPLDSSILFRVTIHECTLLAGQPTTTTNKNSLRGRNPSFAVIQVVSNALIMFQSIENPDASGSKTLHVSVDNLSALVNTEFKRVSPSDAPPMIEPTGAEFRVVYSTENFGCVVSQDISLDCEVMKSCLTPNDLSIMIKISRTMFDRLRAFGGLDENSFNEGDPEKEKLGKISSLIRYKKKGTGIATRIRAEIQTFSFVLLRTFKSHSGAPEFLDFNLKEVKGLFEGCMSALSGECSGLIAVNFFNPDARDWEYAIEPVALTLEIEQMPNELVLNASPSGPVQLNLTGIMLTAFAEIKFDILRDQSVEDPNSNGFFNPSVLSTVGLRRATERREIKIHNTTGLDVEIVPDSPLLIPESEMIRSGATSSLKYATARMEDEEMSVSLKIASSEAKIIGERDPIYDLPITPHGHFCRLYLLKPTVSLSTFQATKRRITDGRTSPESILSDAASTLEYGYYNAEPVVEWCMQNQRLRPNIVDVFSLPKGRDFLSSTVWSPEDETYEETSNSAVGSATVGSPERKKTPSANGSQNKSNWLRPYLKNDSPEWTDMTCMLRMARERVMLPDSRWMWVNDWSVDVNGRLGEGTDADGWSYASDFETFSLSNRYYEKGDACRRRRWTRTRMVKPPRFDDPLRQLKLVWETLKGENGSISVALRSHVRIKNMTPYSLTFFVYSPSWDEDKYIGTSQEGEDVCIPITCASAPYMRIAKMNSSIQEKAHISDCVCSERFMIIPTSYTSSSFLRTQIDLKDVSNTILHFLIEVRSDNGVVDVIVEPVFRILNLLPCQLECQVGEVSRLAKGVPNWGEKVEKNVLKMEALKIQSGKTGACTAVSPFLKPHLSFRVPGYQWSPWHRIINRRVDTWRPSENEEEWLYVSKGDSDAAEELKTLVRFERLGKGGDPLILVMSVECGHCPTIRIFAQYWILDQTGFGCRFAEGFADLMGSVPDTETSRRSYLPKDESSDSEISADMTVQGHQWSIGMSGMTLYFSKREKLALSIEAGIPRTTKGTKTPRSKWISPLDVSNVIPKTVFSVDEVNGTRRFELAINVTLCPGLFARTKMISLLPRYQIVNLLHRELIVAQDGCLETESVIPSQSSIPLHWEKGSLAPKIRIGAPSSEERAKGEYIDCWTNGRVRVDRVGVTSMRMPTATLSNVPMVVQTEVRLATKDQSSAVVVVIWSGDEKSNPLYMLRNRTRHTILCRQPLQDDVVDNSDENDGHTGIIEGCTGKKSSTSAFECGTELGPIVRSFLGLDRIEEFVWVLKSNEVACFGLENPEIPHNIEWACVGNDVSSFENNIKKAYQDVDAMGTSSVMTFPGGWQVRCQIRAEHSTKVIEFVEYGTRSSTQPLDFGMEQALRPLRRRKMEYQDMLESQGIHAGTIAEQAEDDENIAFSVRLDLPSVSLSVVDNSDPSTHGREIMLGQFEEMLIAFSQTREGYHEYEFRLMSFQIDNHVHKSFHPVLVFCPRVDEQEPLLHMSAVRRLQHHSNTLVFRYAAIRLLEVELYLDRRTAETIARFIHPLMILRDIEGERPPDWLAKLTRSMDMNFGDPDRRAPREVGKLIHTANSGRIYFEQLHLHPVRLGLTFTQEWVDWNQSTDTVMVFQFLRGMASIANAPLVFTSFVVGHVFEAPQALVRVIATHYSSQLTKQVFGILGSLAILGAPADFISNVGTGVRDFFYEPIQGAVHGPRQFIEGLEAGTQSLARGVFVGVVRGAANVTDAVNSNLAGLTADDDFIDERKAHQRMLTDAMSRGTSSRTFGDSLNLACASVARGVKSGAFGIVEQPALYASKHGPVGFLKGVGKAVVGAVVKPVVGLGDGVVLVMNHMSDATSKQQVLPKIPKRLRRALPSRSMEKPNCVRLEPYDERAAKAQKIVTGGESVEDVYLGHVNLPSHLIIASEQCLWAIDRISREPWCVSWKEISHFGAADGGVRIVIFSQTGLKTFVFQIDDQNQWIELRKLLSMQLLKMANASELNNSILNAEPDTFSRHHIPGIKAKQVNHVFGSFNNTQKRLSNSVKDEIDLVEQCFGRVRRMGSEQTDFFKCLDEEAWNLVSCWGQVFSGLSSRRCIVASIINGSGNPIQIKSTKLVEGGSPCYSIPTKEFDMDQGILHAGGVIILFGWGVVPSLLQVGNVYMSIETNAFIGDLADQKSRETGAKAMPGYQVGFLEKSYDDSGWWAKYWLIVRKEN